MTPAYHYALDLLQQNRLTEARGAYAILLQQHSLLPAIFNDVGVSWFLEGEPETALRWYDASLLLDPVYATAHQNRGNALMQLGRDQEAIDAYYVAMEHGPDKPWCVRVGHQILTRLSALGDHEGVERYWQHLRQRYPDDPGVLHNYANHIQNTRYGYTEAMEIYRSLEGQPGVELPTLYNDWAIALKGHGRLAEARELQMKAMALQPFQPLIYSNYLFDTLYEPDLDPAWIQEEHRRYEQTQAFNDTVPYVHTRQPDDARRRPLRIGYLSADLRYHSIGVFCLQIFRHHNPADFEIYVYSTCPRQDHYTEQFKERAAVWRQMDNIHPSEAARLINEDKLDILVELNGHTQGNILPALFYKPAPIQISWLGHVHSLGLSTVDYYITDAVADPPGLTETQFVEQLLRLPDCFLCFAPYDNPPEILDSPALANGFITFGLVGNFAKINPYMVGLYARIMKQVPESRCLVKSSAISDPVACERLVALFAAEGIDPERLILRKRTDGQDDYLKGFREIDILLDFYPFNGETITCAALQMGLPLVTLAGNSHRSRAGLSIVTTLGHPEWAADSEERFVEIAVGLAADIPALNRLHRGLREQFLQSPLCDGERFTRNLEAAYRQIWEAYCR